MLLEAKTAIIYDAAGAIGSEVARAYAREGALVHLVGRSHDTLGKIADEIRSGGGTAHTSSLDVLERDAVQRHADAVAAEGAIDVCFNAISGDDLQGTSLVDMRLDDVLRPVTKALTAQFNIATAAGRHMMRQGSGAILAMAGGREAIPRLGGSHVAWAALAGLCRQLAAEFGPHGVRVSWLLSPGSPDHEQRDEASVGEESPAPGTQGLLVRHQPTYGEVANVATFAASDWARTMTATEINFTGGGGHRLTAPPRGRDV